MGVKGCQWGSVCVSVGGQGVSLGQWDTGEVNGGQWRSREVSESKWGSVEVDGGHWRTRRSGEVTGVQSRSVGVSGGRPQGGLHD